MHLLSSFNLNPDVSSFEQYLNNLSDFEYETLYYIANSDLDKLSEQDFSDLIILSVNIYSAEMDINQEIIHKDHSMIELILKRFLTTILIKSLINKGLLEKSDDIDMTLYKDCSFKPTEFGKNFYNWKNL